MRAAALEQRVVAAQAERAPGRRPCDAVGSQAAGALEALERALRAGPEDPVRRDAETPLQQPHRAAARAAAARGRPAPGERAPGRSADDAVGMEMMPALEALDGALGR